MDTIKLLNNLEVGMPLIVTTKAQGITIRNACLYMGKDKEGRYNFLDEDHTFAYSQNYILDHVTISQELDQDEDLYEVAKLIEKLKLLKS